METFSTEEAAKQIDVHHITLLRWLSAGLLRPSIAVPLKGRTLWRWTKADVAKARKLKGSQRHGPKPKKK